MGVLLLRGPELQLVQVLRDDDAAAQIEGQPLHQRPVGDDPFRPDGPLPDQLRDLPGRIQPRLRLEPPREGEGVEQRQDAQDRGHRGEQPPAVHHQRRAPEEQEGGRGGQRVDEQLSRLGPGAQSRIEDAGGRKRQEEGPVQDHEAAGHRHGPGTAPAQDLERRPDQNRQRRHAGRDVGDQLGVREREEEERHREPDPQEEPGGAGEQAPLPARCVQGLQQHPRPRDEVGQEDGDEEPERLVAAVYLGQVPQQMLPNEEEVEEVGVGAADRPEPRHREREVEDDSQRGKDPRQVPPTPGEEQMQNGDPARQHHADQPLGEGRQGHPRIEEEQPGAPAGLSPVREPHPVAEQRRREKERQRHVDDVEAGHAEPQQGPRQDQGGVPSGPGAARHPPGEEEREEAPAQPAERRDQPRGELALPQEGKGPRGQPVVQHGLLEVLDVVEPGGHEVPGLEHLARDLRVAPLVRVDQAVGTQVPEVYEQHQQCHRDRKGPQAPPLWSRHRSSKPSRVLRMESFRETLGVQPSRFRILSTQGTRLRMSSYPLR